MSGWINIDFKNNWTAFIYVFGSHMPHSHTYSYTDGRRCWTMPCWPAYQEWYSPFSPKRPTIFPCSAIRTHSNSHLACSSLIYQPICQTCRFIDRSFFSVLVAVDSVLKRMTIIGVILSFRSLAQEALRDVRHTDRWIQVDSLKPHSQNMIQF